LDKLLFLLLLIPLIGIIFILYTNEDDFFFSIKRIKFIGLTISLINLIISLIIFILFDLSSKQFQFIQQQQQISYFDIYLGVDGLSVYFVLLTTIIMPLALLSN
jgi:NADH-ubiquinone oxidoreductase chain 4